MSTGEFVQNAAQNALLRKEDKNMFITSAEIRPDGATPKDFTRYISTQAGKPKIQTQVAKRKHPALGLDTSFERTGPKWEPATSNS